jgi:hypothetical protein
MRAPLLPTWDVGVGNTFAHRTIALTCFGNGFGVNNRFGLLTSPPFGVVFFPPLPRNGVLKSEVADAVIRLKLRRLVYSFLKPDDRMSLEGGEWFNDTFDNSLGPRRRSLGDSLCVCDLRGALTLHTFTLCELGHRLY